MKLTNEEHREILQIYRQAGQEAMEKDKQFLRKLVESGKITEEQYVSLVLKEVIAGTGYNDLQDLDKLPEAKVVVPDEAYYHYKSISGDTIRPWIDSTKGKAPTGSNGKPVILASMDEKDLFEISLRKSISIVNPKSISLWYGKVGEVQDLKEENISRNLDVIKQIEKTVFREEQQSLMQEDIQTVRELESFYNITNAKVKLGSNKDWYVIYGETENEITISDLAVAGGIHSEKNDSLPKANSKLAIAESTNELYQILLDASQNRKRIYCNATADTSLVNIKRMLAKELVSIKDFHERDILYQNGQLVYVNETPVEMRDWSYDSNIEMLDLEIIPNQEKIREEKVKIEKWLKKVRETVQMQGIEKEKGLDELRNQIRKESNYK